MANSTVSPRVVLGRRGEQLRWAGLVVALLAGALGVPAAAAPTAAANEAQVRQAPVNDLVDYVALGDSYSSGVGTGVYEPDSGDCRRSPLSYPPLWAARHRSGSFQFVACSGATTAEVRGNQISALGPGTDLVTLTVGGNDVGFGPVLRTCTVAESDRTCIAAVNAAQAYARSVLPGRLARTYDEIRRAAPQAQVIVLGYPRLFDLTPSCAEPLVPNQVRRDKLNEGSDVLNTVIYKTVSQRPGFSFSDVRDRFDAHGVCSADPWINGPSVPAFVGPYHPDQTGYREGYLDALNAATGAAEASTSSVGARR